jgi:tetratricopeptide (TPR) repeat protein
MSPEQIRSEPLDARSDVFSLGILLYQLATGVHPFERPTPAATASAILNDPPSPGSEPATLTAAPGLQRVVQRALAKDKRERYASAAEVAADLQSILAGVPLGGVATPHRTRNVLMVAALVAAVALGSFAIGRRVLTTPPSWDRARFAVALAPFVDRTGEAEGPTRAAMLADLLATDLGASRIVRAVGIEQTRPLLAGFDLLSGSEAIGRKLSAGLKLDYVLVGTLSRRDDGYVAHVDVVSIGDAPAVAPLVAESRSITEIAERLAGDLRRALPDVTRLTAVRDDRADLSELTSASDDARLVYERGRTARRDGRLGEAIDFLERATAIDPEFAMAHAALADALDAAGYGRRAREAATRALALSPEPTSPARERLALQLRATHARLYHDTEAWVETTSRLAELYPDEPDVLQMHALALGTRSEHDQALAEIDRAIAVDPARPDLRRQRARTLMVSGRFDDALHEAEGAEKQYALVRSEEGVASIHALRAQIHARAGRYDDALRENELAVAGFEKTGREGLAADARLATAEVALMRGDPMTAEAALRQVEAVAEETGNLGLRCRALTSRGSQLYLRGQHEPAEEALRAAVDAGRLLENDSHLLAPVLNLASLLDHTGRSAEAVPLLSTAIDLARSTNHAAVEDNARLLLGGVAFRAGDISEAIDAYTTVAKSETATTARAWAWAGLAEAAERRGHLEDALTAAEESVRQFLATGGTGNVGYAYVLRALARTALNDLEGAHADIARAESQGPSEDLAARCRLARAVLGSRQDRWGEARRHAEAVLAGPGKDIPSVAIPARSVLCDALSRTSTASYAERACREAREASEGDAVGSVLVRATALERLRRSGHGESGEEPERLLERAEALGMPLVVARVAAVVSTLPVQAASDVRRKGQAALQEYVTSAPPAFRAKVLARDDIRELAHDLQLQVIDDTLIPLTRSRS